MPTVWITGGKGFIGRHMARLIAAGGQPVFGIGHGLWPAQEAARWSYSYWCNGEIEPCNLSQLASVSGLPDVVYHLAGGSSVGTSLQNPFEDFTRTVDTTARLLEWLRLNTPGSRIVVVSSAAVYGVGQVGRIDEDAPLSPGSPYGFHKAMMESVCKSYSDSFGFQICIVRLFSVYGAELQKQLIWDVCCKLAASAIESICLDGTGNEVRDWLHVSDAAELLWLARHECNPDCRVINGGTGIGTKVEDLATLVCRAWGVSPAIIFSGKVRKGDPSSLVADTKRARQLGFDCRMSIEKGVLSTVEWFKQYRGQLFGA